MNPCALLVHDDPAIRTLLGVRLEAAGFHAVVAADGLRAAECIRDYAPSLILIDLTAHVPGVVQLVQTLARPAHRDMEVCVIADADLRDSLGPLTGIRWLTRGQVFHPGFTLALRRRFEDGIPYEGGRSEPFFLDV
jgi:CheY-like chemotaxis protein